MPHTHEMKRMSFTQKKSTPPFNDCTIKCCSTCMGQYFEVIFTTLIALTFEAPFDFDFEHFNTNVGHLNT